MGRSSLAVKRPLLLGRNDPRPLVGSRRQPARHDPFEPWRRATSASPPVTRRLGRTSRQRDALDGERRPRPPQEDERTAVALTSSVARAWTAPHASHHGEMSISNTDPSSRNTRATSCSPCGSPPPRSSHSCRACGTRTRWDGDCTAAAAAALGAACGRTNSVSRTKELPSKSMGAPRRADRMESRTLLPPDVDTFPPDTSIGRPV